MKKIAFISVLSLMMVLPNFSEASTTSKAKTELAAGGGRKKKNGSYRKKKGFLWGLFKGKNQCDCPKH